MSKATFISLFGLFVIGLGYVAWLEYECDLGGVMTWEGKVCAENL